VARLAVAVLLLSALLTIYLLRQTGPAADPSEAGLAMGIQLEGWPRQLSWEDFRNLPFAPVGVPDHSAEIGSTFLPAPGLAPDSRGGRWRFLQGGVEVQMDSARSWVKEEGRRPDVLSHEQCHLDITGLAAREWVERLQTIDAPSAREAVAEAERSYREMHEKMRLVQRLYDHATRGHESALLEWQERIARLTRRNEHLPEPGELPGYSALGGSQDAY